MFARSTTMYADVDSLDDGISYARDEVLSVVSEMQGCLGLSMLVDRDDGSLATFAVEHVATYPKAEFPTNDVYGDLDHPALRLITCGGVFDEDSGNYADNVVVYAVFTGAS